jgi:hypothetical protein
MIAVAPAATVSAYCMEVVGLFLRIWAATDYMYCTAAAMIDLESQAGRAAGYRLETPLYLMGGERFCLITAKSG